MRKKTWLLVSVIIAALLLFLLQGLVSPETENLNDLMRQTFLNVTRASSDLHINDLMKIFYTRFKDSVEIDSNGNWTFKRNVDMDSNSISNVNTITTETVATGSGNLTLSPAGGEVVWVPVWEEKRAHITQFYKPGVNYPSESEIGVTPVLLFSASVEEWIYYEWTVPDNYDSGSDIKLRLAWAPTDATTGDVVWAAEYTIVTPNNNETLTATTATQTVTDSAEGLADELLLTDFITISGTGVQTGDVLSMRIYRDADADDYDADAALIHLGLFFQIDRNGVATPS